jgi:hypothetical protein
MQKTATQSEVTIDYDLCAELLKEVVSPEFRRKMESNFLSLGRSRTAFTNYISAPQTKTLKVDKYIGLIEADDSQPKLNTFDRTNNKRFNSYQQSSKALDSEPVLPAKYKTMARLHDLTPEYLLNLLGR